MQLISAYALLSALAMSATARKLGLMILASGTKYQYASIMGQNDNLVVTSTTEYSVTFNEDGSVSSPDGAKFLTVNKDNQYVWADEKNTAFYIKNGFLRYTSQFYACPGPDGTTFITLQCSIDGGAYIQILAVSLAGSPTDEPAPSPSPVVSPIPSESPNPAESPVPGESPVPAQAPNPAESPVPVESPSPAESPIPDPSPLTKRDDGDDALKIKVTCSGCALENYAIKEVETHLQVFAVGGTEGNDIVFKLTKDATIVDGTGRGVYVDTTGEVGVIPVGSDKKASSGFGSKDNKVTFNGLTSFFSCPSGPDKRSLSITSCTGGTAIELVIYN